MTWVAMEHPETGGEYTAHETAVSVLEKSGWVVVDNDVDEPNSDRLPPPPDGSTDGDDSSAEDPDGDQ